MSGDRAKRIVASIYSRGAKTLYQPLVVNGGFRILGGNLNELVAEQGRAAVLAAGGEAILDMPVGNAHFTTDIARHHDDLVVGTDIAEGMVREAAGAARREGLENLTVVQADAHALPFGTGSFAVVMCTNGLQVIPGLEPTVAELARVLRHGGRLYVSLLSLGLGSLLPPGRAEKLPTMFRSGSDVVGALERAGLAVADVRTERLATLIEAGKI